MAKKNFQKKRNVTITVRKGPNRRRNNNRRNNGGRAPKQTIRSAGRKPGPGSRAVSHYGTTPARDANSSAWYKSLFDPAHAREYGCVGVPDENQDPTVVMTKRIDESINNNIAVEGAQWFAYAPIKFSMPSTAPTADVSVNVTQYGWAIATSFTVSSLTKVTVVQLPTGALIYCLQGKFVTVHKPITNASATLSNVGVQFSLESTVLIGVVQENFDYEVITQETETGVPTPNHLSELSNSPSQMRLISSSMTVDNVTNWANVGGYFSAGHIPVVFDHDNGLENYESDEVVEATYHFDLQKLDGYVTYSAGSAVGAYVISRPRNVDNILQWNSVHDIHMSFPPPTAFVPNDVTGSIQVGSSKFTLTLKAASAPRYLHGVVDDFIYTTGNVVNPNPFNLKLLGQTLVSWDASFVTFIPTTSQWSLRMTRYYNIERKLSYDQGGSDGARCDRTALNLAISALDYTDFTYPASKNDGKKVRQVLTRIYRKYRQPIMSAMGIGGVPNWITKTADTLMSGLGDWN